MTSGDLVDSHHHLWDTDRLRYELFEEIPALRRPYRARDYEAEATSLGVRRSICVEAASARADGRRETDWLLDEIEGSAVVAGLVAWAPLDSADVRDYLDWLVARPGVKPIVGVRRSFEFEDDDFPPSVASGARVAGERGLVVDLVLFARSLPATLALVKRCPETQFVLDHLGKPDIRAGTFGPWADAVTELASHPNVACKLSGLPNEAERTHWTIADVRPYVEHAFSAFGSRRVLFGSDWPVIGLAGGFARWFAAVQDLIQPLPEDDRRAVLGENAARIYGI